MSRFDFLDSSAWHYEDKAWLVQRKDEWKYIQKNLKLCASTLISGKNFLSAHKNFFFKGEYEVDRVGIKAGTGYLSPLFLIWYYPDLSSNFCDRLLDSYSAEVKLARNIEYEHKRLFDHARKDGFDKAYGLMGGREEWAVKCLCGQSARAIMDKFDVSYRYVLSPNQSIKYFCNGMNCVLRGMNNPWHPGQYLSDFVLSNTNEGIEQMRMQRLLNVFKSIQYFEQDPNTAKDDEYAVALRDKTLARFEKPEGISEYTMSLWHQAGEEGL